MGSKEYDAWVEFIANEATRVEIVGDEAGESCDFVVCRLVTDPLLFPDNLVTPCSKCFRLVQLRPHAPKRPARLCDECAGKQIAASGEKVHATITRNTALDVANYFRKKAAH